MSGLLLLLLLQTLSVLACDSFTNPTLPDLSSTFTLGQTVDIHWDVDSIDYVKLVLHHWGSGLISTLAENKTNNGEFFWKIGDKDNVTAATIAAQKNFVLIIQDPDGIAPSSSCGWVDNQVQSPGFVITTTSTSTSTTATPTSTSSSTTSSVPATTTTPAATTTSAAPAPSGGLSTGASAGIGAGIGAAVLLFGASLGLFFYTRRKNAKRAVVDGSQEEEKSIEPQQEPTPYAELSMSPKYEMDGSGRGQPGQGYSELTSVMDTQELDSRHMRYELDSGDTASRSSGKK